MLQHVRAEQIAVGQRVNWRRQREKENYYSREQPAGFSDETKMISSDVNENGRDANRHDPRIPVPCGNKKLFGRHKSSFK